MLKEKVKEILQEALPEDTEHKGFVDSMSDRVVDA